MTDPTRRQFLSLPALSALFVRSNLIRLEIGDASCRFTRENGTWAFDSVWVRGIKTVVPLSRSDSFFLSGGEAQSYSIETDSDARRTIRFRGISGAEVIYSIDRDYPLPRFDVTLTGVDSPVCAWRTAGASQDQSGAWATRGETACDAENREVFIDASGRLVFGHSRAAGVDAAYVIQAYLLQNLNRRGKSMQPSSTFFKSGRSESNRGYFGYWQLRIGPDQPKHFGIVFDRDLGGRMHDVCERYYARAVDSQVDLASVPDDYDPYRAIDLMPLRLSCPESLIPHYGWHMEEYFPGYAKASYPFGEDSGIQTAALLSFEGHATRRDWEKYFGQHVIQEMPLWAPADGEGFFTKRPGGWTRWAYNTDYVTKFPLMVGGNWSDSEHIYRTALLFDDAELKQKALGLMRHDVEVKLDLEKMWFPPCWNPLTGTSTDHRDDWETTAALGYCAEISSQFLYPETGDKKFLAIANRITDWLASQWGPEIRMNRLHANVNTFHCFMGPLVRSMVHRYERGGDARFLAIAQDLAWVMILTLCCTSDHDIAGRPLAGVTCVGVRGCVDYDCTPNLCHEKDLPFLDIMGALLPHVGGPGYAKFLAMQKLVLPRDSWKQAFRIQEQRGLNLRTNYDNYARAMANLAFGLNRSSDPMVAIYEQSVPIRDSRINAQRHIVLANGTKTARSTKVQVRFLQPGTYQIDLDGRNLGLRTAEELEAGIDVRVDANMTRRLRASLRGAAKRERQNPRYDASVTHLSDLPEFQAQRGVGLPIPVFRKDSSFRGNPLRITGQDFGKGLGLAANTVIAYRLDSRFEKFSAQFGIAEDAPAATGPKPSAYLTIFVDGRCCFTSGATFLDTPLHAIELDVRNAQILLLRMSGNWDDDGDLSNDMGNLGDPRLIGQLVS